MLSIGASECEWSRVWTLPSKPAGPPVHDPDGRRHSGRRWMEGWIVYLEKNSSKCKIYISQSLMVIKRPTVRSRACDSWLTTKHWRGLQQMRIEQRTIEANQGQRGGGSSCKVYLVGLLKALIGSHKARPQWSALALSVCVCWSWM